MGFPLSARSRANLTHVHPDLVRIVERAAELATRPFTVIGGARAAEQQRENVVKGASKTMRSRHRRKRHSSGLFRFPKPPLSRPVWQNRHAEDRIGRRREP